MFEQIVRGDVQRYTGLAYVRAHATHATHTGTHTHTRTHTTHTHTCGSVASEVTAEQGRIAEFDFSVVFAAVCGHDCLELSYIDAVFDPTGVSVCVAV